jgi:hypothetical protein
MWQSFIVLGIIPGTNIQTNLNFWLAMNVLFALFLLRRSIYALAVNLYIRCIAWQLAYAFDHAPLML